MENWRDEIQVRIGGMDAETLRKEFDSALRLVWVHMETLNSDIPIRRVEICVLDRGEMEVTALAKAKPV